LVYKPKLKKAKKKKKRKKDKGIPSVMCIINDDLTSNRRRCNHVMKKKLEKEERK
jgi:hypothetical protein